MRAQIKVISIWGLPEWVWRLLLSFLALFLAFAVGGLLLLAIDVNPREAYSYLLLGNFGSVYSFSEILVKATPLMMTGLAFAFAYRTGLFNIGAEGQMYMGAIGAVLVSLKLAMLPGWLLIPLALLAAMIFGGIWGGMTGLLKVKFGANEIITTIMLNYIALYFLNYLITDPLREASGGYVQTDIIAEQSFLPLLIPDTRLHLGFLIALAFVVVFYLILWKTPFGFQLRAVGFNRHAAEYAGVHVSRNLVAAMAISGAFAGVAGFTEVNGLLHRLIDNFGVGLGFDGIAVALLGNANPFGIVVASFLFGLLRVGANAMQRGVGVPANVVYIIQGLTVLFLLAVNVMMPRIMRMVDQRRLKASARSEGRISA